MDGPGRARPPHARTARGVRALTFAVSALVVALAIAVGASGSAYAAEVGYTDGTQCDGPFCPGAPPPVAPVFAEGQSCKIDVVDPVPLVYVTEHFVYGTTPPPAGVVPVTDDASLTFPYHGVAPGLFQIDVTAFVAGKRGFRADTWNIGQGVTAWVPFDCTNLPTTTTSIGGESSTTSPSRTTASVEPLGSTTTPVDPLRSPTPSVESLGSTTTVAGASASGALPFTGGGGALVAIAVITLSAGVALVVGARHRRRSAH
jgi:hypothetical protein